MRHLSRLWYAIPVVGIGLAFVLPRDDAFASFARTGHAIAPEALLEAARTPPGGLSLVDRPMPGCRIRAWRVDLASRAVVRTLEAAGLTGSRVRWRRSAEDKRLTLESQTLYDPLTWARATVLNDSRWNDRSCLVRVEEPQDGQAVWNRMVARVQRGVMR